MLRMSVRQRIGSLGVGAAILALAAGPLTAPALADTVGVSMTEPTAQHYAFTSSSLTVPAGSSVTWTNRTGAPHTVTANGGAFGSGLLTQNQTFQFTFSHPGTYTYYCTVHPYMHGSIIVTANTHVPMVAAQPAAPSAPPAPAVPAAAAAPAPAVAPPVPAPASQIPAQMPNTGGGGAASGRSKTAVAFLALLAGVAAPYGRQRSS